MDTIRIRGARTHNLKNIDLDLPRDRLIVITGLSGSGKSSLAFDTLYAEGQRRYVESLSSYARQFLSMMEKPDVDHIEGLSPAISIEQKSTSHNPRSTVGTITEVHDYLRLLFARTGTPHCPDHGVPLAAQTVSQMVDATLALDPERRLMLLAPIVRERKGEHVQVFEQLRAQGFVRARVDGAVLDLDAVPALALRQKHTIEVVIDRFRPKPELKQRLAESFETCLRLGEGLAIVADLGAGQESPSAASAGRAGAAAGQESPSAASGSALPAVAGRAGAADAKFPELLFSSRFSCPSCDYSLPELEPRLFSFNSPVGACPRCDGLGITEFFDPARVVPHPELSLAGGAVRGWDRRNAHFFQMILALAKHYAFDPETPWQELPARIRDAVLSGSGEDEIAFRYLGERATTVTRKHPFEGIVPNLERRYRETESSVVREELARYISERACPDCGGARLNRSARHVTVATRTLPALAALPIGDTLGFFATLTLPGWRGEIAARIVKEIRERLTFLVDVGLEYLTLDRKADSLSGGEAQRIRLASQIGAGLVGVMYVLDEPSIGLHQRDNERLLGTLRRLRDLGNTVIVVEHDEDAIRAADHILDIGPGAGVHGGQVVAMGSLRELLRHAESLTARYLREPLRHPLLPRPATDATTPALQVLGARLHNLREVDVAIPRARLSVVTGVSGSGKSSLARGVLLASARALLGGDGAPQGCRALLGLDGIERVLEVDQTPIGKTTRSCPATYVGIWDDIRRLLADTLEARMRGWTAARFSFNTGAGRCPSCDGQGAVRVEMNFLPDVIEPCDDCGGLRFNAATLEVRLRGLSAGDILALSVDAALEFFAAHPRIVRALQLLHDVGLGYLRLGQPSPQLSGGEAQRLKLVTELASAAARPTLYVLDEPTVGLHMADVDKLIRVLLRLADAGHTVVVIEHNLDVMASADWIVDLGPEGGSGGGRLVHAGPPARFVGGSGHTARALGAFLHERGA